MGMRISFAPIRNLMRQMQRQEETRRLAKFRGEATGTSLLTEKFTAPSAGFHFKRGAAGALAREYGYSSLAEYVRAARTHFEGRRSAFLRNLLQPGGKQTILTEGFRQDPVGNLALK